MIDQLRAAFAGAAAAWSAPARLADDVAGLVAAPAGLPVQPGAKADRLSRLSLRYSRRTLRLLAALPGGRWRNTCLFRSAAECLALRHHGFAARLCLGVSKEAGAQAGEREHPDEHRCDVRAHAWVEIGEADGPVGPPAASDLVRLLGRDAGPEAVNK